MVQVIRAASRLAAVMLLVGASSAFGALYTFDLTSATRITSTVGGGLVITSNEDSNVTVVLTALATSQSSPSIVVVNSAGAGVDDGQGGGSVGEDDIEGGAGAETLIISPYLGGSPFTATVESVTFSNVETTGGGDDATIFLDSVETFDIAIGDGSGSFTWNAPANTTFSTSISFENSDGNDDFEVSQIALDIASSSVPEPATWTLLGFGVAALVWVRRRRS